MTILITAGILACAYASQITARPPVDTKKVVIAASPPNPSVFERTLAYIRRTTGRGPWVKSLLDVMRAASCVIGEKPGSSNPFCDGMLPPRRYLVGWALVIVAALIRQACFREMGRFFTFTVSIQDNHKLIRSGPYSIIRHPGYAACIPLTAGIILVHIDHLPSFGGASTSLLWRLEAWFNLVYISGRVIGLCSLLMRADVEDSMLREHCGQEWVEYSQQVPDKFIPYAW